MSQQLINHSQDLLKLRNEGINLEIMNGFLIVHNIPYVNSSKEIHEGRIITELTLSGNQTSKPRTHVVYFEGEIPCDKDGKVIQALYHSSPNKKLTDAYIGNHMFSNKPSHGYSDYYKMIVQYVRIISAPAKSLNPDVTEKKFLTIESKSDDCAFKYIDSNSSRAGINDVTRMLEGQRVAIVGLGGTGSYLLDFIAKTPVKKINIFDGDLFLQHNAFRAPGAPSLESLRKREFKTDYLKGIYSEMHHNINSFPEYMDSDNVSLLDGMDIVFICIDRTDIKKIIIDFVNEKNISFIDVGIGVNAVDGKLSGIVRVTTGTEQKRDHIEKRISFAASIDDDYSSNIQIAELNALNASLAVMKWKKMLGFYHDFGKAFHSTFTIDTGVLINEED